MAGDGGRAARLRARGLVGGFLDGSDDFAGGDMPEIWAGPAGKESGGTSPVVPGDRRQAVGTTAAQVSYS
jgi:hypothetical protein